MKTENNENEALNKTDVSSSFFDDIFNLKEEIQEPINMPKDEFVEKTKKTS